ncbi:transposase domain-containing protein [Methylophaga nitratireducenticrescens]|uniref:transposase domain-containing protein n=1 Tax=Methylophaga nitratireducenticrescens TaxID=754476 RepID=UPI000CDC1CDF|nr:transposase domain-containing protein [Methylophaga nitratireducenticrescens]AUZ85813.1 DNA-binding protein [Methylophaga nitratireducenticrescens]AUZ85881.1 DNA-binding protein [Methylophaga nitratireducenticrescens]
MTKEWFTAPELAGVSGMPKNARNIKINADKNEWKSQPRTKGKGLEYHISSLPPETQAALLKQFAPSLTPIKKALNDADFSYDQEQLWQHYDVKPQKQKDKAQHKLDLLLQVMALIESSGVTLKNAFTLVAEQNDISERTMQGWYHGTTNKPGVKNYKRQDWLAALIPSFVGRTSTVNIDDEAWEIFKADYLRLEQPTATACYYRLQRTAVEHGWAIPSLKTIERRIRSIPLSIRVFKREGEAGLIKIYPAQDRTVEQLHSLQWINGDGYQHNVFVRLPNGDIERLKTWFWQDVYSRKIIGYRVDESENTDSIRLSFGDVVEQFGIPEHATIDNTRAAANKWMTGGVPNRYRFKVKEDDPLGLLPSLGVKVHWTSIHAGKGHGQAKPIERSFGVGGIGEYIDKHPKFAGAYTGANPMAKPENYAEKAIPIETFLEVLQQEIIAWNAKEGRRTEICAGVKSYDQAFNESYQNSVIRKATAEQRRMWMLSAEAIKVQKDGSFTLDAGKATGAGRNRYHAHDLFEHVGQKIVVRFDPQALHETVYVYTLDSRFICDAQCIDATGFGDTEAARSHNKYRTRFIKATKIAAKAEMQMDVMQVAERLPQIEQIETIDPKIVRPLRPTPQLGRVVPRPQLNEQEQRDLVAFQAGFSEQNVNVKSTEDDPMARYKRWLNLDNRMRDDGLQLSASDLKFWSNYQKGDEFQSMQEFVADFKGFDLTVEA